MDVDVEMSVRLLETQLSLKDIAELKEGTIIPVEMPDEALVYVEELPTFHAKLGRTKDKYAIKVTEKLKRPESMKTDLVLMSRGRRIDKSADDF